MKLITAVTVGAGGASAIDFNAIPGTYSDLVILLSCRGTGAGNNLILMQANNITTNSYTTQLARGETAVSGGTGTSNGVSNAWIAGYTGGTNLTSNTFTNAKLTIADYTSTSNKSFLSEYAKESNDSSFELSISAGTLTMSAAITSIKLTLLLNGATFAQHTTAYLYGITRGNGGSTVTTA